MGRRRSKGSLPAAGRTHGVGHKETLRSLPHIGRSARLFKQRGARFIKSRHQFIHNGELFKGVGLNPRDFEVTCASATLQHQRHSVSPLQQCSRLLLPCAADTYP